MAAELARFVTVEGLDGAGKTTHLDWLQKSIEKRGVRLCRTREPGGTELGEKLRALLLATEPKMHPETEALLMFAARREHLEQVIRPALAAGTWVLCDRFTDATYAYQSGGSGVAWQRIETLERWVQDDLQPDLTFYFDVDPEVGRLRTRAVRTPDRFEQEQMSFHAAVRAAYLRRASEHRERIRIVDANRSIADIELALEAIVEELFCGTRS